MHKGNGVVHGGVGVPVDVGVMVHGKEGVVEGGTY